MPDLESVHIPTDEWKTTKKCPNCGEKIETKDKNYKCTHCSFTYPVDMSFSFTSNGVITNIQDVLSFRDFTEEQRQALAKKGHALPDGSFPISNRTDLSNAIRAIGRAKNRSTAMAHIKKRARELGATEMLPAEWSAKMSVVNFTDTTVPRIEGDLVIRNGLLFTCGDYPDKKFSLTVEEAKAAESTFQPVPINIEHIPSIFDDKLGHVRKIWTAGEDIFAEYAIPKWLHEVTKAEPIKVSAEWDRLNKQVVGGAFVLNPRVQQAAMMAAFSNVGDAEFAHKGIAAIHDMAVRHGAECGGKSMFGGAAKFMTKDELKTIQGVHDMCSGDNGKHCDMMKSRDDMYSHYSTTTSTEVTTTQSQARKDTNRANQENDTMPDKNNNWWANFWARFSSHSEDNPPKKEEVAAALVSAFAASKSDDDEDDKDADGKKKSKKETGDTSMDDARMSAEDRAAFTAMQTELASMKALFTSQQETIANQQKLLEAQQATFANQQQTAQFAADTRRITDWVQMGKMLPAEAKEWEKVAQENPAHFAAAIPAIEARTPLPMLTRGMLSVGANGDAIRAQMSAANPDADRLVSMAKARAAETDKPYHVAFSEICRENPALADAYRANEEALSPKGGE